MSIQGITGGYLNPALQPDLRRPQGTDEAATRPRIQPPAATPTETRTVGRVQDAVPTEAPAGTDPALWSVLTSQERAFFARARTMGPVTYGPGRATGAQLPGGMIGGRLDVKV